MVYMILDLWAKSSCRNCTFFYELTTAVWPAMYLPAMLYNLWRTAVLIDVESRWDGFAGGKGFTMMLFVACIADAADSFANDRGK